jgi:hypothetical protein
VTHVSCDLKEKSLLKEMEINWEKASNYRTFIKAM